MRFAVAVLAVAALGVVSSQVAADPLSIKAVMSPEEQIRADLPTGQPPAPSKIPAPIELTGYGMHDIRPGVDGSFDARARHIRAISAAEREFELTGEAIMGKR